MDLAAALLSLLMLDAVPGVTGRCADGRIWITSDAEQTHMLGLINTVRADHARPPLLRVRALDRMAMAHAVDMACRNYFAHENPERQPLADRFSLTAGAGAPIWRQLSEILGTSSSAPRQVRNWLDSRSHRGAMLEADQDGVGVGLVRVWRGPRVATFWAVEFVAEQR
jgi:uncharacterized protein YkwD